MRAQLAFCRNQAYGVLLRICVLPQLDHSFAERAVPQPAARHDVPAQSLRHQVGGHLAVCQAAVGKVPQRLLSGYRFVDDGGVDRLAAEHADRTPGAHP